MKNFQTVECRQLHCDYVERYKILQQKIYCIFFQSIKCNTSKLLSHVVLSLHVSTKTIDGHYVLAAKLAYINFICVHCDYMGID